MGKIPEQICVNLLQKYEAKQQTLKSELTGLEEKLSAEKRDKADVEEFIQRLKKYFDIQKLTREICLELIEYITVSEKNDDKPRSINIYYKFLDRPLAGKRTLFDEKNA